MPAWNTRTTNDLIAFLGKVRCTLRGFAPEGTVRQGQDISWWTGLRAVSSIKSSTHGVPDHLRARDRPGAAVRQPSHQVSSRSCRISGRPQFFHADQTSRSKKSADQGKGKWRSSTTQGIAKMSPCVTQGQLTSTWQ